MVWNIASSTPRASFCGKCGLCVCARVLLACCGLCSLATYILSRLHISLRDLPVACAPQTLQPKNFGRVREAASSDDWKVSFTLTCKSVACCKHWTDKKWREVQTLPACKFGVANCSRKFQGALVPNTCFQSEVLGPFETKTIYYMYIYINTPCQWHLSHIQHCNWNFLLLLVQGRAATCPLCKLNLSFCVAIQINSIF